MKKSKQQGLDLFLGGEREKFLGRLIIWTDRQECYRLVPGVLPSMYAIGSLVLLTVVRRLEYQRVEFMLLCPR